MATPGVHTVTCSACKRSYNLSLAVLARRKACTFCGAALALPADVEAQLKTQAGSTGSAAQDSKASGKLPLECPLCMRRTFVPRANIGHPTPCGFCTCLLIVQPDGKAAPYAPRLQTPDSVLALLARLRCPTCPHTGLELKEHTTVRCSACGAIANLASQSLDKLVDLSSPAHADALSDVGREALRARWARRELGLAEAAHTAQELRAADTLLNESGEILTRAPLEATIDVVQYVVLCAPQAIRQPIEGGLSLTVVVGGGASADRSGIAIGSTIALNVVGIGLMAATGVGFTGHVENRDVRADPAFILEFSRAHEGTTLNILQRIDDGSIVPANAATGGKVFEQLQRAMPDGLRRYHLFRALYGHWVTGQMLYGTPITAVRKRLEQLGGVLAAKADELAKALVPAGEKLPG
jgi:hypothetical protein